MSVSFDIGFSSETKANVHVSSGMEVNYHPKKGGREEFLTVECYDSERKTRAHIFVSGEAIDTLLEKAGVISVLRFKEQP